MYLRVFLAFLIFYCLIPIPSSAQQSLNLDFETVSLEGESRPWGWDMSTYTTTVMSLDKITVQSGEYSLRLKADTYNEMQVISFFLEPYELKGKTIQLDGWVKTIKLGGQADVALIYYVEGDSTRYEVKSKAFSSSVRWTAFTLNSTLPPNTSSVSVEVRHHGVGTAWFDGISLYVEGIKKESLEIAPPFNTDQVSWVESASVSFNRVDTLEESDEDLEYFKAIVGDAKIIAMGESTHGTREFFQLKRRMLEYAIKELGVRLFAIEDHQLIVQSANNYVLGGPGTARSSMNGMLGVWQTEEVRDLIQWIRDYNDQHPDDKVEFVGFDMQNHFVPIDSLKSFVQQKTPELTRPISGLLEDLEIRGMNSYAVSDSTLLAWYNNANKVLDIISAKAQILIVDATNEADSLVIQWGVQYANLVKQFAENAYKGHESLYRDVAMANNVSWLLDTYKPGSKMLIWAHDVHISRGDHPEPEWNIYSGISMGSHLSKKYKTDYKSFGISTYEGSYSCYVSYVDFRVTDCPLYNSPTGSLGDLFHQVAVRKGTPNMLVDFRSAKAQPWFVSPIPIRFANHVNIEYGYWLRFSMPYQFDGIYYVDQTSSAKSYAR